MSTPTLPEVARRAADALEKLGAELTRQIAAAGRGELVRLAATYGLQVEANFEIKALCRAFKYSSVWDERGSLIRAGCVGPEACERWSAEALLLAAEPVEASDAP